MNCVSLTSYIFLILMARSRPSTVMPFTIDLISLKFMMLIVLEKFDDVDIFYVMLTNCIDSMKMYSYFIITVSGMFDAIE